MSRNNKFTYKDSISLKEYFDLKVENIENATNLARQAMEKRLEGMNEFRDALKDQASKFITRAEIDLMLDKIGQDIRGLRESRANSEGKASAGSVYVAYIIAIIGIIIGVISLIK